MKKVLLFVVLVTIFTGCASTQSVIDGYVIERNKVIESTKRIKCKKDCSIACNQLSNAIDRISCKVECIPFCNTALNKSE